MAYPIYNTPTPEQVDIDRRRKMADMLREQSMQNTPGQMISGHYVGPSWTQHAAKLLGAWKSGKLQDEADEKQKAYDAGAETSMGEIQKMYSDPNANDEQRNAAFMAHSQKYGGRGIDTYLQAQNATTQMRNAATAAENARRKSEKISQDAEQGTGFLKALFPGAAFKQKVGGEDYDVDYMGLDEQGNPVNQVQPMTIGFDQEAARTFGFDDDAMGRIMSVAQKDPKLASRIALEEYKRLSKGKSEAKDVLAKERAMAQAMGMPVGDYLKQKMNKSGQSINIHNVMPDSKPVTPDQTEKLVKRGLLGDQLGRLEKTFKDDYAGYGLDTVGNASNWMQSRFGKDSSQVNWWKDYKDYENQVRHELFGAALTGYEIDQWQHANVSPGMKPDVVRENLRRRKAIEQEWMDRTNQALGSSGYVRESVGTATGKSKSPVNQPTSPTKQQATQGKMPPGIDANVWKHMTPQERALWK